MVSRLLSRLLFCIALLTQIGAPIAGGLAMAAERGAQTGSLTAFCRLLHDDELGGTQDPSKAPRGERASSERLLALPARGRRGASRA